MKRIVIVALIPLLFSCNSMKVSNNCFEMELPKDGMILPKIIENECSGKIIVGGDSINYACLRTENNENSLKAYGELTSASYFDMIAYLDNPSSENTKYIYPTKSQLEFLKTHKVDTIILNEYEFREITPLGNNINDQKFYELSCNEYQGDNLLIFSCVNIKAENWKRFKQSIESVEILK